MDGRFSDLADVLRQVPGLRTAHARVLNVYETHAKQSGLDDFEFTALLDLCPDEGDDDPDDWPDTVAGDHPMTLGAVSIGGYNPGIIRRMAVVGAYYVAGVNGVPVMHDGYCAHWYRDLGSVDWWGDSFPSWSGGISLGLIAPGAGCAMPTGDLTSEKSRADGLYAIVDVPLNEAELGAAVINWARDAAIWFECEFGPGSSVDVDFSLATRLEPLDPEETLTAGERSGWESFLDDLPAPSVTFGDEGIEAQARAAMAEDAVYADTKQALADPKGPLGRALRAASRAALYDNSWLESE